MIIKGIYLLLFIHIYLNILRNKYTSVYLRMSPYQNVNLCDLYCITGEEEGLVRKWLRYLGLDAAVGPAGISNGSTCLPIACIHSGMGGGRGEGE